MFHANSSDGRRMKNFSATPRLPEEKTHWLASGQAAAFEAEGTTAHRLCSESNAWVERFGEDLLLSYKHETARDRLLEELAAWCAAENRAFRRTFAKFIPRQNEERIAPTLLSGDAALPLETVIEENRTKFGLDFAAGYSAGLFIDQRANRAFVRRLGAKRLLNTFAYTCSFSVAAALGGAETVSVDLSKKSLDRGRENFALNALGTDGHQFIADDVLEVLPRLARRGERFDCLILDPPTFSRGNKGRRFQVEQDFEKLLTAALEVAGPQARILLSTNCTRLERRAIEQIARYALKFNRRGATFYYEPALPDLPAPFGAQTVWLLLKS
jgi:23S rRNA (cytosine1962-C5)-methyltransferase